MAESTNIPTSVDTDALLKLPDTTARPDNVYKQMYSVNTCSSRPKNEYYFSNYLGLIVLVSIIIIIIITKSKTPNTETLNIRSFLQKHDIVKLLIGLLLLNHIRELSNSLVSNIILPVVNPIIPFIQCTFYIKYLDDYIELGNFITDLIIFSINIIILYILYLVMIS